MMNSDHVMYFCNLISEGKVKWQRVHEVMAIRIFLPVKDQTEWRWPAISQFLLTTSNFPYRILNFNSPLQQMHSENISVSQAQLRWASSDLLEHEKTGACCSAYIKHGGCSGCPQLWSTTFQVVWFRPASRAKTNIHHILRKAGIVPPPAQVEDACLSPWASDSLHAIMCFPSSGTWPQHGHTDNSFPLLHTFQGDINQTY